MLGFIFGLLLSICAIVVWTLERTYQHVPERELKRLAQGGDQVAQLLYRPVSYGVSLRLLLAILGVVFTASALELFVSSLGAWLAVTMLVVLGVIGGAIFVPTGELTRSSLWLARTLAPAIAWVLERLHAPLSMAARFLIRRGPRLHTGLYEKADLVDLLERQKAQPDSRLSDSETALLQHALTFGDKLVSDALVPKRVVKLVSGADTIGPVLMDELAKSGHSRFPVYEGEQDNVVGVLYLRDLVGTHKTGRVDSLMNAKLTYVHEDFTLWQALQAFLKTKRHLFIVVNGFEEFVGILTIEDVLEQMIGKPILDEFDRYDDLRAVAAASARKEHKGHDEPQPEPVISTEVSNIDSEIKLDE